MNEKGRRRERKGGNGGSGVEGKGDLSHLAIFSQNSRSATGQHFTLFKFVAGENVCNL